MTFTLRILHGVGAEPREHSVELGAEGSVIELGVLPGASALHLELRGSDDAPDAPVLLRAEVEAEGGETVAVRIFREGDGLRVESAGRRVFLFSAEEQHSLLPILRPRHSGGDLDLLLVVDGTVRLHAAEERSGINGAGRLWADAAAREKHAGLLGDLALTLAREHDDVRVGVLAFGDSPVPGVGTEDLVPAYLLHPDPERERLFDTYDEARLESLLRAVPPTSGGDFVDALGDALLSAAAQPWRDGARKVLLVSGESPGLSVTDPPPEGADAQVRSADVESALVALHRAGIEVASLYHDGAEESGRVSLDFQRPLLRYARRQYARLASQVAWAFVLSDFDPAAAAANLLSPPPVLARGPAPGWLRQPGVER